MTKCHKLGNLETEIDLLSFLEAGRTRWQYRQVCYLERTHGRHHTGHLGAVSLQVLPSQLTPFSKAAAMQTSWRWGFNIGISREDKHGRMDIFCGHTFSVKELPPLRCFSLPGHTGTHITGSKRGRIGGISSEIIFKYERKFSWES